MALKNRAAALSSSSLSGNKILRLVWYPTFAAVLVIFLASIPGFLIMGPSGIADVRFSANSSPLILSLAWVVRGAAMATGILSLYLALLLFRRCSNDRMALLTSFFILVYGIFMPGTAEGLKPFFPAIANSSALLLQGLVVLSTICLFAVFPDGRFVPRWVRWVVAAGTPAMLITYFLVFRFSFYQLDFSRPGVLAGAGVIIVLILVMSISVMYAQVYRYRRVSMRQERQQTKWVVYGIGLWFSIQVITSIPWAFTISLPPGAPLPLWMVAATPIWILSIAIIPVTLTIAVLRYRLFEIDFIINRTLVYGGLSLSVVGVYVLFVGGMGMLFQSSGNFFVAFLATGLVAVLFNPLRQRLQRGVNHLLYGERDEPLIVLQHLGERLESSKTPEDFLPTIVETVSQSLKLPYTEITLRQGEKFEPAAHYGIQTGEPVPFPILYQGQTIGYLNIALRGSGEPLADADKRLLAQVAHQAGPVARAVQLARDLRQSRARLVAAREEERQRLRRDLHDGLGPGLASQGLKIAAANHLIETDPEAARKLLDELASMNEATVKEIRRLVYALRPTELDQLGLVEAVREYTAGLNVSRDIGTRYRVDVKPPGEKLTKLSAAVELAAYRIATEALTNVTHHAHAQNCTVSFRLDDTGNAKTLLLAIADDGVGFEANGKAGIGLNSMRERAEELGGELHIESILHEGTHVTARLPLVE